MNKRLLAFTRCSHPSKSGFIHRYLVTGALIALLGLVCTLTARAEQGGKLTLDTIVAPDTLLYVDCSGVDELKNYSENLDFVRLWADEEVQGFLAEAKAMLPQMLQSDQGMDIPVKALWDLLKGNIAAAMSPHLAIFEEGAMPTPVLAMDMTGRQETFMATVNNMLGMAKGNEGLESGVNSYRGFEVSFIGLPRKRMTLCYTTIQNLFVTTFNAPYLHNIIDRYLDKKPSLAGVESYQTSRNRVHADAAGLVIYLNLQPVLSAVKPFCPFEVAHCLDSEGLAGINALCLASSIDRGGAHDSFFIHCPGEKKGLVKALFPHAVSKKNIAMVPPDALFLWDMVVDPGLLMEEVDNFVANYIPEIYSQFRYEFDRGGEELGFDIEKELLAPLGSEICFFVTMPTSGGLALIPDLMLIIDIDDEAGFQAFLDKLLAMAGDEVRVSESSFDGAVLKHITIPEPGFPFTPTFTIRNGKLYVASAPTAMKKYMKWLKKGEPGLAATKGFQAAVKGVPENASCLKYVNLRRCVEMGYSAGGPFLPSLLQESNLPLDVGMLPMTETVAGYISNAASYAVADKDGIMMSGYWPLGTAAILGMAVTVADYLVENDMVQGLVTQMGGMGSRRTASTDLVQTGMNLMQNGQHEKAIQVLSKWIDAHPGDASRGGMPWLTRGYCKLVLKRYAEGIEDYKVAAELDANNRGLAYYNITCGYSCLNKVDLAFEYLEKAVAAGWYDPEYLNNDSDLDNIRNDERFAKILNRQL